MTKYINKIGIAIFFILVLFSFGFSEETFTITTYYPSPYGSYNELTTAGNTYLATSSGNVGIGTASPTDGKLEVNGEISTGNGGLRWKLFSGTTGSSSVSFAHGVTGSKIYAITCVLLDSGGAGIAYDYRQDSSTAATYRVFFDGTNVSIAGIGTSYDDAGDRYRCIVWYTD